MLPNTVVIGGKFGPHVLSVSEDSLKLAYIGPTEFTVTVANARSLDEVGLATQLIVVMKRTRPELEMYIFLTLCIRLADFYSLLLCKEIFW